MLALVASGALNPSLLVKRKVALQDGAIALAELDNQANGGITFIKG